MKRIRTYLVATILFNTAIATALTMLVPVTPFWVEFVFSQCIGLSVMSAYITIAANVRSAVARMAAICISLPGSVALGLTLAFLFTGVGSWSSGHALAPMAIGLFFGLIGAIAFLLFERSEMEADQRRLMQSESERRELEARLKVLQAQIEPHFLFNTLANVGSLIDSEPALAKQLLTRLNDWLRLALVRSRSDHAALGDELDMLENYLQILKMRFGERLRWDIEAETDARLAAFPPMLLQPLVENAVRHGIEPKIGGGTIAIRARSAQGRLHIEVRDDGMGIQPTNGGGTGLANVRERLATLFGGRGRLDLHSSADGGTVAILELPVGD